MFTPIINLINQIDNSSISDHRKVLLKPLYDYLALKIKQKKAINPQFYLYPQFSKKSTFSSVGKSNC